MTRTDIAPDQAIAAARTSGPLGITLRIGWITIRLLLAFWAAEGGAYFVYQGF